MATALHSRPRRPFCPARRRCLHAAVVAGTATLCSAVLAQGSGPGPHGPADAAPVLLSVLGRLAGAERVERVDFDMARLAALPQHHISTRTPWYPQPRRFTGPLLRDVLAAAGAQPSPDTVLRLRALNDYRVDMPARDARDHAVIIARLVDDRPVSVREKGPLMVIYPYDDQPSLRTALHYGRAAWQLRTIELL